MAKALLTLKNGAKVTIEGSPEEVQQILGTYGEAAASKPRGLPRSKSSDIEPEVDGEAVNLHEVVNLAKTCDEAEAIEIQILDRSSQVDRTLLPLYLVHQYLSDRFALSSGEIAKVTRELGVPVSQPNASKVLSGVASRYVMGDSVRKKGRAVKYKLNRRGVQYLKSVIGGANDENPG